MVFARAPIRETKAETGLKGRLETSLIQGEDGVAPLEHGNDGARRL